MYYGKYRAIVVDVNDPERRGRIKIKCPAVLGENTLAWALPNLPPNIFMLPNVGDLVWVEFEGGNIDYPIWTGCFYTTETFGSAFGNVYSSGEYNKVGLIKTKKSLKIVSNNDLSIETNKNLHYKYHTSSTTVV